MGLFTRWTELLVTQDSVQFAQVCTKLLNAGIGYRERVQPLGHGNRRTGSLGSLGENMRYTNLYQIYVKKEALEHAQIVAFREQ